MEGAKSQKDKEIVQMFHQLNSNSVSQQLQKINDKIHKERENIKKEFQARANQTQYIREQMRDVVETDVVATDEHLAQ